MGFKTTWLTLIAIAAGTTIATFVSTPFEPKPDLPAPTENAAEKPKPNLPSERSTIAPAGVLVNENNLQAVTSYEATPTANSLKASAELQDQNHEVYRINLGPDIAPEEVPPQAPIYPPISIGQDIDPESDYTGRSEPAPQNLGPEIDPEPT